MRVGETDSVVAVVVGRVWLPQWLMGMGMRRLAHLNSNNSNNIDINEVKVLEMGPRTVSPSVGNARWRGIEHGRTTFIIRVGNRRGKTKRPTLHAFPFLVYLSVCVDCFLLCCMPVSPFLSFL